jgi:hypothetical protein
MRVDSVTASLGVSTKPRQVCEDRLHVLKAAFGRAACGRLASLAVLVG